MGDIVNRTHAVAGEWQRQVVWVRMNVAFIQAELPVLRERGHDTSAIEALLASFEPVFEQFCHGEFGVFSAARIAENENEGNAVLIAGLSSLRETFRPWVLEYDRIVEKTRTTDPQSLPLVLLEGCGAEVLLAHAGFVRVVDGYLDELRK